MLISQQHKKSQISIEFIIILFFLLIFFAILFMGYAQRSREVSLYQDMNFAEEVVISLALKINDAYLKGDGSEFNLFLPPKINDEEYTIKILNEERIVLIIWNENQKSWPLITSNIISGNITSGFVEIKNNGGVIYVQ